MDRSSSYCIGGSEQNHPKEKEMQEGKVLQIPEERREVKRSEKKGRKGKIYPAECRVPENSKER